MNPEHSAPREAEPKSEPQYYYFSEKGSVWSPVMKVGEITNTNGETTKYILGEPNNPAKNYEVPAAWFDDVSDQLAVRDGEAWSVAGKPTLESANPTEGLIEMPDREKRELGSNALEAAGIVERDTVTRDAYRDIARTADRLAGGTFDAAIMTGNMKQALDRIPQEKRDAQIAQLLDNIVDNHGRPLNRGGTGSVARHIQQLAQKHLS